MNAALIITAAIGCLVWASITGWVAARAWRGVPVRGLMPTPTTSVQVVPQGIRYGVAGERLEIGQVVAMGPDGKYRLAKLDDAPLGFATHATEPEGIMQLATAGGSP
tara:strand:- start:8975 stop:9295 length:321 start_codon:yes stop_codon:yes gene_type:complete